jgi:hypothetical protein
VLGPSLNGLAPRVTGRQLGYKEESGLSQITNPVVALVGLEPRNSPSTTSGW